MTLAPRTPRAVRLALAAAVAAALALRIGAATMGAGSGGDEDWYLGTARALASGTGAFGEPGDFVRPPLMSFWIAAVTFATGAQSVLAIRVANALLGAAAVWIAWRAGRAAFPRIRTAAGLACAWVLSLEPSAVRTAHSLLSENLATPLTLAVIAAALAVSRRPSWRRAAAFGVVSGALVLTRTDAGLVVAGAGGAACLRRIVRRGWARAALVRWAGAAAVALALCVPWSLLATARVGRPVFVASFAPNPWFQARAGWLAWLSNVHLPREEWLTAYWAGGRKMDPARLPDTAFASAAERTEVLALLARDRAADAHLPEVEDGLRRLGEARRAADPWRFHAGLPTRRLVSIWFDPTEHDPPEARAAHAGSLRPRLLARAAAALRPVAGLGLVLAVLLVLFRARAGAAVPAAAVAARAFGMIYAIPLATGAACYEARYMDVVVPVALMLVAGAALVLLRRRRR